MPLNSLPKHFLSFTIIALLLSSCSAQKQGQVQGEDIYQIKTIAVLPSSTINSEGENLKGSEESLQKGAEILGDLLAEYLDPKEGIQFVSTERQESLLTEYNQNESARALSVGKKLNADAILTSRVNRYRERTGQDYSVDNPASISFEYKLILVDSGQSLCAGVFDETQQSISENLLSFKKAFARGGKWITTKELAREGVKKKLGTCRFLNK